MSMRRACGRFSFLAGCVLVLVALGGSAGQASAFRIKPGGLKPNQFQADMAVTSLIGAPDPVPVGAELTYTITVTNNGPDMGGGTLKDQLDSTVTYESSSVPPGNPSCVPTGSLVLCLIPPLDSGASVTVSIVVTPNQEGSVSNTATIQVAPLTDPDESNNSLTISTQVVAGPTPSPTTTPPPTQEPPPSTSPPSATPSGGIQTGFGGTAGGRGPGLPALLVAGVIVAGAIEALRRLRRT